MEIPSQEVKLPVEVPARQCYPVRHALETEFEHRVADGQLPLTPVDSKEEAMVVAMTWDFRQRYPDIDFSFIGRGETHSYEEVAAALPEDQRTIFEDGETKKLRDSSFAVAIAQNAGGWWVGPSRENDQFEWLDSTTLHSIHRVNIGSHSFIVNDFSGNVDVEELIEGVERLSQMMAAKGVNIGSLLQVLNIQPEEFPAFTVDPDFLEKNPKAHITATASKKRGILNLNERVLRNQFTEPDDKEYTVSKGWGQTIAHELGHFVNTGLADLSDSSFAEDLGWTTRAAVTTDDYGNVIPLDNGAEMFWGHAFMDDYGHRAFVTKSRMPKMLTDQGYKDHAGKIVGPPSTYAETSDSEDLAESFAASIFEPERLDDKRQAMVARLIDSIRNEEDVANATVSVENIDLATFDPWREALPHEIKYLRRVYVG